MRTVEVMPAIAACCLVAFGAYSLREGQAIRAGAWLFPAVLSISFLIFSLVTISREGILGFWTAHTENMWGNQVWFDLLLAVGIAWFLIMPRARAAGMRPAIWLVLVMCTGCIGLLAMLARLLQLEEQRTRT
jgi:hypothetical protein